MTEATLGIIPARGGSKRVEKKNIRKIGGKPLIAHTIEQAIQAEQLDWVIVSTEDEEIMEIAKQYGGNVPFQRPSELASDDATNNEVVKHALDWCESEGKSFEYVCLLSVTTPFRNVQDIDDLLVSLYESTADSVVSITNYDAPPFWATELNDGVLTPYFDTNPWKNTQTQSVPTLYHPNSSIFAAGVPEFKQNGGFYDEQTIGYKMPRERSLDIDEPFDLELARALYSWREQ